jgi:type IV secretory pathway VirB2 component (pilin)
MLKSLESPAPANELSPLESGANRRTELVVGVAEKIGWDAFVVLAILGLLIYFGRTDWPLLITVLVGIWSLLCFRIFWRSRFGP